MQFYVKCEQYGHIEKVYVHFAQEPQTRGDIPFWSFQMTCSQGHTRVYSKNDVVAEVGLAPIGGAILGGILFLVDPLIGLIGAGGRTFWYCKNRARKGRAV